MFSGLLLDFTLSPILYLEENRGKHIDIMIEGTLIRLPATWYILASDPETMVLDTIQIADCSKKNFKALLMDTTTSKYKLADIKSIDLIEDESTVYPMMEKGNLLCYPIGPDVNKVNSSDSLCIAVGVYDLTPKYLTDVLIDGYKVSEVTIGDLT